MVSAPYRRAVVDHTEAQKGLGRINGCEGYFHLGTGPSGAAAQACFGICYRKRLDICFGW